MVCTAAYALSWFLRRVASTDFFSFPQALNATYCYVWYSLAWLSSRDTTQKVVKCTRCEVSKNENDGKINEAQKAQCCIWLPKISLHVRDIADGFELFTAPWFLFQKARREGTKSFSSALNQWIDVISASGSYFLLLT